MKLLFDANLSPRLATRLRDLFAGSTHVFDCGDISADDRLVWRFAAANGLTIVSKDSDFQAMSFVLGQPPKVIRLRVGNGPTCEIEKLLRNAQVEVSRFESDAEAALLVLDG